MVARAAHAYYAFGDRTRGDALLTEAKTFVERDLKGDEVAPWVLLSEGYQAAGKQDQMRDALLDGMERAARRPGFNRDIAFARTLCAMAVSGATWDDAEIRRLQGMVE